MRNVLCQCCYNILWRIPSGLALVKACTEGERELKSSTTEQPGAAPRETQDPVHSAAAGSGSPLWPVKNRKALAIQTRLVWLSEECASVFASVECKTTDP